MFSPHAALMLTLILILTDTAPAVADDGARWGITPQFEHQHPDLSQAYRQGRNPHPTTYRIAKQSPLSGVAELGKQLFHDPSFSISGKLSCASCHDPHNAYQPPADMDKTMRGGVHLDMPAFRPPPSLRYLYRQNGFSIGPDLGDQDDTNSGAATQPPPGTTLTVKTAKTTAQSALNWVPQGGLFWDGRASTLQQQADGPLTNPVEMAAPNHQWLAAKLDNRRYRPIFTQLFGPNIYNNTELLVAEMEFAIARYQIEDQAEFYPFSSKYDQWLQGKARFTPAEMRGYLAFNDVNRGDCAACHSSQPTKDGLPPLFTDQQYEALGVPRNPRLAANHDSHFHDLGICGPMRRNFAQNRQYCGMFITPTLRNIDRRHVFFHNARYSTLKEVMDFYNFRDSAPGRIYPRDASGNVVKYDDLPKRYQANIDVVDPPFDRHLGQSPAMSAQDEADIIAFLHTLDDADVAPLAP